MNKVLTVWFDDKGNLLTSAKKWQISVSNGKSEVAKDFADIFEYRRMDSGLGVARAYFKSLQTNREYSMFIDDFDALIKAKKFINNQIQGMFRFIKRGQSQAIKLILEKPSTP